MSEPRTVLGVQIRLIDIVALMLLGGLVLFIVTPVLIMPMGGAPSARCKSRLGQLFKGARLYLNNYDEFFPLAWHEGTGDTVDTVTYNRFLIHASVDTNIDYRDARGDDARAAELFTNTVNFWADPATGLTNEYFSPPAIFRLPRLDEMKEPFGRHTQYTELTSVVASTNMPFLTEAAATTPQPEAVDPLLETHTGIHGAYKSKAFTLNGKTCDAFYGVARSWRGWDPEAKEGSGPQRFDFRHSGAINVIFLDGHVCSLKKDKTSLVQKLHENWNYNSRGAP